jgi:hypothetical protein
MRQILGSQPISFLPSLGIPLCMPLSRRFYPDSVGFQHRSEFCRNFVPNRSLLPYLTHIQYAYTPLSFPRHTRILAYTPFPHSIASLFLYVISRRIPPFPQIPPFVSPYVGFELLPLFCSLGYILIYTLAYCLSRPLRRFPISFPLVSAHM